MEELPNEVLQEIVGHLDVFSLYELKQVNRRFYEMVRATRSIDMGHPVPVRNLLTFRNVERIGSEVVVTTEEIPLMGLFKRLKRFSTIVMPHKQVFADKLNFVEVMYTVQTERSLKEVKVLYEKYVVGIEMYMNQTVHRVRDVRDYRIEFDGLNTLGYVLFDGEKRSLTLLSRLSYGEEYDGIRRFTTKTILKWGRRLMGGVGKFVCDPSTGASAPLKTVDHLVLKPVLGDGAFYLFGRELVSILQNTGLKRIDIDVRNVADELELNADIADWLDAHRGMYATPEIDLYMRKGTEELANPELFETSLDVLRRYFKFHVYVSE